MDSNSKGSVFPRGALMFLLLAAVACAALWASMYSEFLRRL